MSDAVFEELRSQIARSVADLAESDSLTTLPAPPMSVVLRTITMQKQAERLVALAVERARGHGSTWQEIGDALGISRQGAFQRFGRPVDPRTGKPITAAGPPLAGVEPRALAAFALLAAAQWDAVRADFGRSLLDGLSASKLADTWAKLISEYGGYQRAGVTTVRRLGDYTVVLVPLTFEHGELIGRVAYNNDGKVEGLFVLDPAADINSPTQPA